MKVFYENKVPGYFVMDESTEDNMHEFSLSFTDSEVAFTSYFRNLERAKEKAQIEFSDREYTIGDLTIKETRNKAEKYRNYIKKLRPSMNKSSIILDMRNMVCSRTCDSWHTTDRDIENKC